MSNWIDIGAEADFSADEKVCTTAGGRPVVVCRVEGQWCAFANCCPHAGLPIGEGDLRGRVITCPFHGYAYNVRNGRNIDWPQEELPLRMYPVRVEDGRVWIDMADKTSQGQNS